MFLKSYKSQRLIAFIFVNTMQYPCTMKSNVYHSSKRGPSLFFHSDSNTWPCFGLFSWLNPCTGCNSRTDLVLAFELYSFNFISKPNKSLRFTRFRRSYKKCPAVGLINQCQSYIAFLFDVCCLKQPLYFFAAICPKW